MSLVMARMLAAGKVYRKAQKFMYR